MNAIAAGPAVKAGASLSYAGRELPERLIMRRAPRKDIAEALRRGADDRKVVVDFGA
jgi:hypothetical protein